MYSPAGHGEVTGYALVGVVPPQDPVEVDPLFSYRQVRHALQQVTQLRQAPAESRLLGLKADFEIALSVARAIESEARKVDRLGGLPRFPARVWA